MRLGYYLFQVSLLITGYALSLVIALSCHADGLSEFRGDKNNMTANQIKYLNGGTIKHHELEPVNTTNEVGGLVPFDIKPQSIASALIQFGEQAAVSILLQYQVRDSKTDGLKGEYNILHGLEILLAGSDLDYRQTDAGIIVSSQAVTAAEQVKRERQPAVKSWFAKTLAVVTSALAVGSGIAMADEESDSSKGRIIEEVMVTAMKRAQSAQEIPVALSAFSGQDLAARGIMSPQDLARLVPSLSFGTHNNNPGITMDVSIRGVSSPNSLPGGDPGVPVHMNGHYLQAANFLARDLLDIERIEVLRGPQGTLYGRNANGGSVNIITNQPTDTLEGSVSVEAGKYDLLGLEGVLNIPLSDSVRTRFAFADRNRDGYIRNVNPAATQRDLYSVDYRSVRGQVDIDFTDDITAKFGGYSYKSEGELALWLNSSFGPIYNEGAMSGGFPDGSRFQSDLDSRTVDFDQTLDSEDEAYGYSFNGDWDLGGAVLSLLSAYNVSSTEAPQDLDNSSIYSVQNTFNNYVEYKTKTAEIQLVSDNDSNLTWVGGVNYYEEDSLLTNPWSSPPPLFGVSFYTAPYAEYEAEAYGVYGNVDYQISDKLTVFGGLRYNEDKKDIGTTNITFSAEDEEALDPLLPVPGNVLAIPKDSHGFALFEESATFDDVSFRVGANYFVADEVMAYGSVSSGYRPGGFNADSSNSSIYDEESTLAYEIGLKSHLFDNRLMLNVAAYLTDYADRQEALTIGVDSGEEGPDGEPIIDFRTEYKNIPESEIWGIEVESAFYVSDNLTFDLMLSHMDATINSDFIGSDIYRPQLGVDNNFKGNRLAWTPEWKYNLGVQYDHDLPGDAGLITARADYSYVDEQYSEYFNRTAGNTSTRPEGQVSNLIPAYDTLSLSVSWYIPTQGLRVEAFVRNVFDEDDLNSIKPGFQASYGTNTNFVGYTEPRTYSLKLTKEF
jgi:iron complex outermembrane receptor protein